MQRNVGAYRDGVRVFPSCFILAPSDPTPRAPGRMTITMPGVTVFNYIYYPCDVVWFGQWGWPANSTPPVAIGATSPEQRTSVVPDKTGEPGEQNDIGNLVERYERERGQEDKTALAKALVATGDERAVEVLKRELFDSYQGRVLPRQEGMRVCSLPGSLGMLGRHSASARKVVVAGMKPSFWEERITWSVEGVSAVDMLVRSSILGVGFSQDDEAWRQLLLLRENADPGYLRQFAGSLVEAACDRYWLAKRGENESGVAGSLHERLMEYGRWLETADGRAWDQWYRGIRHLGLEPESKL
ncbi:MAG: hypothetical protein H7A46_04845 [Verrucomicrobiales bacterium]|nr:hypothetical protein [Verrucomicrobiales bacterium]